MDLRIEDVAELLNAPISTIKQWVKEGKIPAYRLGEEMRFSRMEIENWMVRHGQSSLPKGADEGERGGRDGTLQYSLYRAIHAGGVFADVEGSTKEEVIRNTMALIGEDQDLDAEMVTDMLLDRERLSPTALGNGVAVPHTRDSFVDAHRDLVAVAYPKQPIDYGALDGESVQTLFFLFAHGDKRHLHLLAKIAHLSSQEGAVEFLRSQPSKAELLAYVKEWEAKIPQTCGV